MEPSRTARSASSFSLRTPRAASDSTRTKIRDKAKAKARRHDSIGHLGPEAVVAFVDGEMERKSAHRVRVHLVHCEECRSEVHQQRGASEWVRHCSVTDQLKAPRDLLTKLAGIATDPQSAWCATAQPDTQHPQGAYSTPKASPEPQGREDTGQQDILDKIEMIMRAIKHNQRSDKR